MNRFIALVFFFVIPQMSFARNLNFIVCTSDSRAEVFVTDESVTIKGFWQMDHVVKNQGSVIFQPGDLGESEEIFLQLANIEAFQQGLMIDTLYEKSMFPVYIFDYGNQQKSVLMFTGGWPFFIGRTEDCRSKS